MTRMYARVALLVLITVLLMMTGCVNAFMIWDYATAYQSGDIVLVREGEQFHTWVSMAGNNLGHYPPESWPDWWTNSAHDPNGAVR